MSDYINIGCTPADEDCFQLGHSMARKEAKLYKKQLQKEFPEARLEVKSFPHDFGMYYSVIAVYSDEEQEEIAFRVEEEALPVWSEVSKIELALMKRKFEILG